MDRKKRLRMRLVELGLTQRQLAKGAAIHESALSQILLGKYPLRSVRSRRTRERVVRHVSEVTGIPVAELVDADETAATAA